MLKKIFLRDVSRIAAPIKEIKLKGRLTKRRIKGVAALVLVVLLLGLLQVSHPSLAGIQRQVVLLLTSPAADWTPALDRWASAGIWQDSFEKAVFNQGEEELMLLPVSGEVLRPFQAGEHPGIDIAVREGGLVKAALAGEVIPFSTGPSETAVALRHGNRRVTIYSGMDRVTVAVGETVPQGKLLGLAKDMVHFEVRVRNEPVDPLPFLMAGGSL